MDCFTTNPLVRNVHELEYIFLLKHKKNICIVNTFLRKKKIDSNDEFKIKYIVKPYFYLILRLKQIGST